MALAIGEFVGDYTFQKPDGSAVCLTDFRGKPLLVIFLRHLA